MSEGMACIHCKSSVCFCCKYESGMDGVALKCVLSAGHREPHEMKPRIGRGME